MPQTTTVTSKGQVTIPKPMRDLLGIKAGDEIEFGFSEDGRVVVSKIAGKRPTSRFEALRGSAGPGPTTDEIMAMLRGSDDEP